MSLSLNAFLPLLLRHILNEKAEKSLEGTIFSYHGTCLFADVSGFTALSEKLASMGKEGSEELTNILNEFYGAMVDEILTWDGDIIKFAGDAMTVFFPDPDGLARARNCAVRMQQKMGIFANRQSPVGPFNLQMKIGLAHGPCIGSIVGDTEKADFLFAGNNVDEAADAEHHAQAGDIIFFDGQAYHKIVSEVPADHYPTPPQLTLEDRYLQRFLPQDLIDTLNMEGLSFANEHRRAVILFVSFEQTGHAPSYKDVSWLQKFYQICLGITREYDGYMNKIDMGDKGAKIIILFGAPIAHEDDPDRAIKAALELRQSALEEGITTRIGANYASIFAGIVGSTKRCEYTVMGDGVNLAARLMAAAQPNGILCHAAVRHNTKLSFSWHDLPPIKVKGKSEPQHIVEVTGQSEATFSTAQSFRFCNRQQEIASIREFFTTQENSGLSALTVTGPQGIGKTALMATLFGQFSQAGLFIGTAHDYTRNTPYFAWKQILKDLIEKYENFQTSVPATINAIIQQNTPQLLPYCSLLGDLVGAEAISAEVEAIDLETRKNILWKIIESVIEELARKQRLFFIFDNYQWLDAPSQGLITALLLSLDQPAPLFIFCGREKISPDIPDHCTLSLELGPFNEQEAEQFAGEFLQVREIPQKVLEKLMQMSKGVPLVIQEVLRSFLDTGYLERSSDYNDLLLVNDLALTSVPQTLDGMVMSRFDRLKPQNRRFLRMMSVFGEEMPRELAGNISGQQDFDVRQIEQSKELGDFIGYNDEKGVVHFRQPYFRTVIYESIDFSTRRNLHRDLGEICQRALSTDYIYLNEILAYHYSLGEDAASAIPYLKLVVKKSVDNHFYSAAVEQYERLVRFISLIHGDVATSEYKLALIELLIKLGEFEKSEQLLSELLDIIQDQPDLFAPICFALGRVFEEQAKFEDAIVMYKLSQQRASDPFLKFRCARSMGTVFGKTGNLARAKTHLQDLVSSSDQFSNSSEYGIALLNLGLTNFHLGQPDLRYFHNSLDIFKTAKDIFNELKALNNLGQIYERQGAYAKSLTYMQGAFEKASQFGYNHLISLALSNIGGINSVLLNFLEAQSYYEKALVYAQKYNRNTISWVITHVNLAEVKMNLADYQAAHELYQKGYNLVKELAFGPEDVCIEYGLFLYKIGVLQTLHELIDEMTALDNDNSPLRFKIARDFFQTVLDHNLENKENNLRRLLHTTIENQDLCFAFFTLSELFELHLPRSTTETERDLQNMENLVAKSMSLFNIIYFGNLIRHSGSEQLVRKLDALLRKYPWPDYSWKRHLWIADYYLRHGKKAAAGRRLKKALQETGRILDKLADLDLRQAFCQQNPFQHLIALARDLNIKT